MPRASDPRRSVERTAAGPAPPAEEAPDLPGLRRWRSVYWTVAAVYALELALLTLIARLYP